MPLGVIWGLRCPAVAPPKSRPGSGAAGPAAHGVRGAGQVCRGDGGRQRVVPPAAALRLGPALLLPVLHVPGLPVPSSPLVIGIPFLDDTF
jgi:hypothetical protein